MGVFFRPKSNKLQINNTYPIVFMLNRYKITIVVVKKLKEKNHGTSKIRLLGDSWNYGSSGDIPGGKNQKALRSCESRFNDD